MRRVLIFSGTTEGRHLAETLSRCRVPALVCVATEYGKQVMGPLPGIEVRQGRMDRQKMRELMEEEPFLAAVDATHPFAVEVSENIEAGARDASLPCLRLKRETKPGEAGAEYFSTNEACAAALAETEGNILLTTGSRELGIYCGRRELRERLYVRVLPCEESISQCRKYGVEGSRIIAMQGPFSEEMNAALIGQYRIRHLVTKESGAAGGFAQKEAAAKRTGIVFYVIGNPEKRAGLTFGEVCGRLERLCGVRISPDKRLEISLMGTGMGDGGTLTVSVKEKLEQAHVLFGSKRLLDAFGHPGAKRGGPACYPFYTEEKIVPVLEGLLANEGGMPEGGETKVSVLFSGDCGFYSGSQKLYQGLMAWRKGREDRISVRLYPGISSVSCLAAACGVSWQDAKILSIHGKKGTEEWEAQVLGAVRHEKKVFLLVSGAEDVRDVGGLLAKNGLSGCRIAVGYQLASPEERIEMCAPDQCGRFVEEGLYVLGIFNEGCEARYLAPYRQDEAFLRGKVPMTKEEIRELAVCKLKLTEHSVVYDIGSGTGSVAAEIADRRETVRVYAVERREEGIGLIRQNREKFGLKNLEIVEGTAPESLHDLPVPTHAFIGGSGGRMEEILRALYEKNPSMRVVMTLISLESVGQLSGILKRLPIAGEEIVQVQVSRAKKAGGYHLMQAENPVYLCSFDFKEEG